MRQDIDRRKLADYLAPYAVDVLREWMRIVEIDDEILPLDMGAPQARMGSIGEDGTFTLGTDRYSDDLGHYRITVSVEPLPPLPPVGPEADPAMVYEMHPCPDCIDERRDEDRADLIDKHESADCPNRPAGWELSTWGMVLYGDEVCLPGRPDTAMMVTSITPERMWHVKDGGTGKWWDDAAIEHITRTARMLDRATPVTLPPETPIEICMDTERRAAYVLQQTFPGSEKLSS